MNANKSEQLQTHLKTSEISKHWCLAKTLGKQIGNKKSDLDKDRRALLCEATAGVLHAGGGSPGKESLVRRPASSGRKRGRPDPPLSGERRERKKGPAQNVQPRPARGTDKRRPSQVEKKPR